MKTVISTLLPVAIAALLLPLSALALTTTVNGITWTYTVSNGKASVGGGSYSSPAIPTSTSGAITIPSTLDGYSVTSIGDGAFYGCSELTAVTIPSSVKSIGDAAFAKCSGLARTSITIPDGVTSIGYMAFYDCHIGSVTIPSSVKSIGEKAFYYMYPLGFPAISVHINDLTAWCGILSGGNSPIFGYDYKLFLNGVGVTNEVTSLDIPDAVTSIGAVFYGCSSLVSVTIPSSVASIRDYAFYGCSSLTSVTISDSVTSIGSSAFSGCSSLTSVAIPNSVTSIGSSAFSDCSSLTSVTIPDSVTGIEYLAFYGCTGLTSVTIPDSVTSIGMSAFEFCRNLTSVTIPASVASIQGSAFTYTGYLSVTFATGTANIPAGAFGGYSPNDRKRYGCPLLKSVTIPNSVTNIGDYAFYGCSGLMSVAIPDSVTSIGEDAFYGCSGLTSVAIPGSVTSIGNNVFSNCRELSSILIHDGMTNIGRYAFNNCSGLTSLVIPDSVTIVGDNAFSGCSGLALISIPASLRSQVSSWGLPSTCQVVFRGETIMFDSAGGSAVEPIIASVGSTLVAPAAPTRPGYMFVGWSPAFPETMPPGGATLVAQWTPRNYTVKFAANGGKGKMAAQTFTCGQAAALRRNAFTRSGWVFLGWARSVGGAVAYPNAASVKDLAAAGKSVTLYAQWAKKDYKVAFYANGGKGTMSAQKMTWGKAAKLKANKFQAPKGKKFAGWATSKANAKKGKVAYKNKKAVKNLVTNGKTVKLYAVWKKK